VTIRGAVDSYAALTPFTGQRLSQRTQCHSSVVLAPLMVVSCFTVPTAPQDGQMGGGVGLIALSGTLEADPTIGI
jgi:hypothetical protein